MLFTKYFYNYKYFQGRNRKEVENSMEHNF